MKIFENLWDEEGPDLLIAEIVQMLDIYTYNMFVYDCKYRLYLFVRDC